MTIIFFPSNSTDNREAVETFYNLNAIWQDSTCSICKDGTTTFVNCRIRIDTVTHTPDLFSLSLFSRM